MFTYYLRHREKKRGKSLSIKKYSKEELIVDFQTQFTDNKRKLWKENQWKPITSEKVVPFTRNHSF